MRSVVFAAILFVTFFTACKPADLGPSKRHELSTKARWQPWYVTSIAYYPGAFDTVDFFILYPNCAKDDAFEFLEDGNIRNFSGALKCNDEPDIYNQGKWELIDADTKLKMTTDTVHVYDITMLNDTTLRLKTIDTISQVHSSTEIYYHNIK